MSATDNWWGEARDASKHSIRQGTFSTPERKNGPTPNVNSVKAEKSCSGEYAVFPLDYLTSETVYWASQVAEW